jgi:hypothetical protein
MRSISMTRHRNRKPRPNTSTMRGHLRSCHRRPNPDKNNRCLRNLRSIKVMAIR